MSKNRNAEIDKNDKNFVKRSAMQEPASKVEKIITYVLIGAALLAVILIIIFAFASGGEKQKIARRFNSLTKDNVFEYVSYEKLQEKVNNGEDFEVVLISDKQDNANYFIYCVDIIVKQYQSSDDYYADEVIYLLNIDKLSEEEQKYFTKIDKRLLDSPVVVHYKKILLSKSVDFDKSNNYKIEEYGNNAFALLQKYFQNNFVSKKASEETSID